MPVPSCKRCGATLKFVQMADTGKSMPVNALPDKTGTIVARNVGYRWAAGYVLKAGEQPKPGFTVFRTHYADCKPHEVKHTRSEATPLFDLN
ncbi:MAG TPA: hypothetical protein VGK17_03075 [Propionicimonas sp.]|jgi:hypothetical protein